MKPVVSDFDLLLVGTRGVAYREPLPAEQVELSRWCCASIERVLAEGESSNSWTRRWVSAADLHPAIREGPSPQLTISRHLRLVARAAQEGG